MYLIFRLGLQAAYAMRLNPYSNGTMYLMHKNKIFNFFSGNVLILILMEQCI